MSKSKLTIIASTALVLLISLVGQVSYTTAQNSCPSAMEEIQVGDTITGRISDRNPNVPYCFEGTAGQLITIDLARESGSLDAFLELTNLDGDEIFSSNDDRSLSTTDAQIVFELPETSAYVINATRFDREAGSTQGTFELTLTTADDVAQSNRNAERPDGCPALYDSIRYGDTFNGTIDDDTIFYYFCFAGQEGDEVVIDAIADNDELDTFLVLTDLRFEDVLAENDDVRLGNRDSRIVMTLPETGSYLITVTRYDLEDGITEGDFTLTVVVNDGTLSDDELFTENSEPNPYECNRPLIQQLNATQWLESATNYDFRLNFGCEGQVAVSILGEMIIAPYTFVGGDLQMTLNENTYNVVLESDSQLTLTNDDDESFVFKNVGDCSNDIAQDLLEGVWFLDENTTLFRLDFLCNGVLILTLDDLTAAYTYDFNPATDNLIIDSEEFITWTEVFILPGSFMSVETEDEPFIFTNVLTELEDSDDAGI